MTVEELLDLLRTFPKDLEVVVEDEETGTRGLPDYLEYAKHKSKRVVLIVSFTS